MLGEIEPGATVTELEVAARFHCSQSTVREALLLLQEEGLVQRSHHRGTRVSILTEDEALEMLRPRRVSDLVPALRAQLAKMEAAAAADDEYALAEADREFHRRLFAEAKLPNVEPLLVRCLIHNHRYKMLNSRDQHDLHHAAQRHVVIIEAVERRDTPGLVAALDHHISTIFEEGPLLLEKNEAAAIAP